MIFQGAATATALPTLPSAASTAVTLGGVAAEHAHVAQSYHYHAGQLPHHDNNNSMMLTELQSAYNQTIPVSSSVAPTSNGTTDIITKPVRHACFIIFKCITISCKHRSYHSIIIIIYFWLNQLI